MPEDKQTALSIRNVTKCYGNVVALHDCTIDIERGEFVSVVGPSGCGKSTLLKVVAGFVAPDRGDIVMFGRCINALPVRQRQTAFVMDRLGLYPHLNVFENIAYPLRVRDVAAQEITRRITAICELTGISGLEKRLPSQLSGGQRQRVAIARALIRDDALLLLADECFSNLDARLRYQLRSEFRSWQRSRNITCIFVTHDQEEALALGDRIALMSAGRIEQIGYADELYRNPATIFAASFIGRPAANMFPLLAVDGNPTTLGQAFIQSEGISSSAAKQYADIELALRPEDIQLADQGATGVSAIIEWIEPMNPDALLHLQAGDQRFLMRIRSDSKHKQGAQVTLRIPRSAWHTFSRRTGRRTKLRVAG